MVIRAENQEQHLPVKNNGYLLSHFPTRRKDSSISKVLTMLVKGNSGPDLSPRVPKVLH